MTLPTRARDEKRAVPKDVHEPSPRDLHRPYATAQKLAEQLEVLGLDDLARQARAIRHHLWDRMSDEGGR